MGSTILAPVSRQATGVILGPLDMTSSHELQFQVTSIGVATLIAEQSVDQTTWYAVPIIAESSAQANGAIGNVGLYRVISTMPFLRLNVTTYTSGTVTVAASLENDSSVPGPVQLMDGDSPIFGSLTANGQSLTIDTTRHNSVTMQVISSGTQTLAIEGSLDATNWFPVPIMPQHAITAAFLGNTLTSPAINTAYIIDAGGCRQIRVRTTAFTSTVNYVFTRSAARPTQIVTANLLAGSTAIGSVNPKNLTTTDIASAAITTTTNTSAITPDMLGGGTSVFHLAVTAVSGTSPTMDVVVQESLDGGTNWVDVYAFPRITATGVWQSPAIPLRGDRIRYVQTIAGTTPSFTRAMRRISRPFDWGGLRRIIDRAMVPTTLNSATAVLDTTGLDNAEAVITFSVLTGTPSYVLEGTADGTNYVTLATISPTAAATYRMAITGAGAYSGVRVRCSVAAATGTLTQAAITGWKG